MSIDVNHYSSYGNRFGYKDPLDDLIKNTPPYEKLKEHKSALHKEIYALRSKIIQEEPYLELEKLKPRPSLIEGKVIVLPKELKEIGEKVAKSETLTFDNIETILQFTNNPDYFDYLFEILNKDIELRNKKFHVDCIKDLYFGEDKLSETMRLPYPKKDDIKGLIKEKLRAIIINEYENLHDLASFEFINGKITYKEYREKVREYMAVAVRLFP